MRIPKYWEREEAVGRDLCAWGWSDTSREEARQRAQERLGRIVAAFDAGREPDRYAYEANPIRELEVERFGDADRPFAIVTRNGYGALVLNTAQVAFVDIDVEEPVPAAEGFFARLFGGGGGGRATAEGFEKAEARRHAEDCARRSGVASLRIYETPAGLRLLLTDRLRDPAADDTQRLLEAFESDPLYRQLCRTQACFRARLTAKPWRIDFERPPLRFPSNEPPSSYLSWVERYERATAGTAACHHVASVGAPASDEQIRRVVELHDRMSGASGPGRLA